MLKYAYHINDIFLSYDDIDISKYNEEFLISSAKRRCAAIGCKSFVDYIELIEEDEIERITFYDSLQIAYSCFFRNPLTFHTIDKVVLPNLAVKVRKEASKDIRIWSSACAAGQEAYSMAMLLENHSLCKESYSNCKIYATDKDEEQIKAARIGQFARHNLDNIPLFLIDKWFVKYGQTFHIKPELSNRIEFATYDLFETNNDSIIDKVDDFHIIFCANLLFYYKDKYRKLILEQIDSRLAENGYIITSETERDILLKNNYIEVYPHSAIFRNNF
ncbi:protein-glutamate O-methyltransferase CheR [Paludibacter sp.]